MELYFPIQIIYFKSYPESYLKLEVTFRVDRKAVKNLEIHTQIGTSARVFSPSKLRLARSGFDDIRRLCFAKVFMEIERWSRGRSTGTQLAHFIFA